MTQLKVNFAGGILRFVGAQTGIQYTYDPAVGNGVVLVNDSDASELKKMQVTRSACGCSQQGQPSSSATINLFEE